MGYFNACMQANRNKASLTKKNIDAAYKERLADVYKKFTALLDRRYTSTAEIDVEKHVIDIAIYENRAVSYQTFGGVYNSMIRKSRLVIRLADLDTIEMDQHELDSKFCHVGFINFACRSGYIISSWKIRTYLPPKHIEIVTDAKDEIDDYGPLSKITFVGLNLNPHKKIDATVYSNLPAEGKQYIKKLNINILNKNYDLPY